VAPAAPGPATPSDAAETAALGAASAEGDALGAGGLGLTGTGEGGGGRGEGIGLGHIGTIGHGAGTGTGQGFGSGSGRRREAVPPREDDERSAAVAEPVPHAAPPSRPAPRPSRCDPADPLCADLDRPAASAAPAQRRQDGRAIALTANVRPGALSIERGIVADQVQPIIRGIVPRLRQCYRDELQHEASTNGRLTIRFVIGKDGAVESADLTEAPGSGEFKGCVSGVATHLLFPAPESADARFTQQFDLVGGDAPPVNPPNIAKALPYQGLFKVVMEALQRGDREEALTEAKRWHAEEPGDVLSLVALGEVFEARKELSSAARAYGSILELFSFRADSRRFAGERLERLADARALALATDTYAKAAEQRPDHPASHRLYAFALLKHGEYEKAFEAIKKGATRTYPSGRFRGVDRILKEDMGLVAAAWSHAQPNRAGEIRSKLKEAGGSEESGPSLRFVLVWETDANDVDFHIHDGKGGHAYYSQKALPSGGELYADVTTGYGPECFTIRGPRDRRAYPYTLQAHYYSRGPMGYGMGKLQVLEQDGNGKLSFDERPFVVMLDGAFVDMGTVDGATKLEAAAMR
jgi:hypothetical protein